MAYRHGLQNFSKGVLSKELWGRSDIAPYNAGVRQGTNVIILKYGGLQKRPGTRLVYEVTDGAKRLIPFEGAYEASYALVMGQASMRLAALGGMVIEEKLTVEAVTLTNPVKITATDHGFEDGDEVYFSEVEGADWLNGLIFLVNVLNDNEFTIPMSGVGLDALTGDNGGVIRAGTPPPAPAPPVVPSPAPAPTPPVIGGSGGWWDRYQEWIEP